MRLFRYVALFRDLIQVLPRHWPAAQDSDPQPIDDRPVVILVSGFAASDRALAIMKKRLSRDGFQVLILSLHWNALSDTVNGLCRLAQSLCDMVRAIKTHNARARVYVVAHSAGGLVARYYVQFLGGDRDCGALITLGTPHAGTWYAALGFFTHLAMKGAYLFHLLPISPFIKKINEAPLPEGFRLINVCSKDDLLGGAVPFPQAQKTVELKGLSHGDFLHRKKTYDVVVESIRETEIANVSISETAVFSL